MTYLLYLEDSYLKEFDAKVIEVSYNKVVLDRTAFYPTGGGQPCDTGKLICNEKEFTVLSVKKEGGKVWHELDKPGLAVGDQVHGIIDWDKRYKLMRAHTASHVLAAVLYKEAGAKITGNQLGLEKSRIDFNLEKFDRELLNNYIQRANQLLAQDRPIKIYFMDREQALKDPELVKLASVLPPAIQRLRIVEIEGIDRQADGGTHVAHTSEVGKIVLLGAENKGKNNRRVYFSLAD